MGDVAERYLETMRMSNGNNVEAARKRLYQVRPRGRSGELVKTDMLEKQRKAIMDYADHLHKGDDNKRPVKDARP